MDFNELYESFLNNVLTDINIVLADDEREISMQLHKIILYSSCIYFKKLLTNFKEENSNNITVNVSNAYVAYDMIMLFYGQKTNIGELPEWKHILESVRCYDFFGLKIGKFNPDDLKILRDAMIPDDEFELLLHAVEIIGYNTDTINELSFTWYILVFFNN